MSRHLSSEQVSTWVMGEHGAPEEEHLRDCPKCRADVVRLESLLSQFRSSVLAQSVPPASLVSHRDVARTLVSAASTLVSTFFGAHRVQASAGVFEAVPTIPGAGKTRGRTRTPRRWVLTAATLVILVTVPLYQSARYRRRAVAQAEADTILMEQVDRAVSRTVPRPMEPLIDLVRWGSNPTEGSEKKR